MPDGKMAGQPPPGPVPAPHCVVATGPNPALTAGWVELCVGRLVQHGSNVRCAVLLADQNPPREGAGHGGPPGAVVGRCFLPCICCPAAADLPSAVRALAQSSGADWLFIEMPIIMAPGLLAEFDRVLGWPRSVVVRMTPAWERARREGSLSFFQMALLDAADATLSGGDEAAELPQVLARLQGRRA